MPRGRVAQPIHVRFWSKVLIAEGCWEWTAGRNREGYGKFAIGARGERRAHCFAFETQVRPLEPGELVCHECDNPPCVRPSHLYAGSDAVNQADKVRRGRSLVGIRNVKAKLSEADVLRIRARAGKETDGAIAADYAVSTALIRFIRIRTIWRHI